MARLTTAARKRLPASSFAIPKKKAYPVEDESHAKNALARVSQFGSPSEKAAVRRKVKARYPAIEQGGD